MLNLKEAFGLKLKELRKEQGLTQEKLAEIIDLTARQLSRIESGKNFISAETLAKISIALDVDLNRVFSFEWNRYITLLANGTDSNPCMKATQRNGVIDIKPLLKSQIDGMKMPKYANIEEAESSMIDMSKRLQKPVTVKYFDEETKTCSNVKTYYPDGRVKVMLSDEQIELYKLQENITKNMRLIAKDKEKLEFIELALKALHDGEAVVELKTLLKGMRLAHNIKK